MHLVAGAGLLVALCVLSAIDLRSGRLPDRITLPGIWAGLGANACGCFASPADAIFGAVAGYGSLRALSLGYGLVRPGVAAFGGGDLKLVAMLGAWLGWQAVPCVLLIAFPAGMLAVLPGLALGRVRRGQEVPFGPALAFGGTVVLLSGPEAVWRLVGP